jgi:hypothetical protein
MAVRVTLMKVLYRTAVVGVRRHVLQIQMICRRRQQPGGMVTVMEVLYHMAVVGVR